LALQVSSSFIAARRALQACHHFATWLEKFARLTQVIDDCIGNFPWPALNA
jgi:hypothetical protein